MSHKVDALICAVIVALTLVIPLLGYFNTVDSWAKFSSEAVLSAARFEQLAKDTELGKIKPDVAGFPAYLRMQAAGQLFLADMFGNLTAAAHKFMSATFGLAAIQAGLLAWLLRRRRGRGEALT